MDRRYRVTGERAIIGESLAGLFIVETFLLQPTLFDTYIALSPSLWWNRGELVRTANARIRAGRSDVMRPPTVVYLSSAGEDNIAPAAARLAAVLRANASDLLRWQYRPRPELTHATIYRAEAPRVLRDLFPPRFSIFSMVSTRPDGTIAGDTARLTPLQRGREVARDLTGPFVVMREEYRNDFRRGEWTKIHLSFHTPDERVNVALTDNGLGLSASARSPGCYVSLDYLQYGYDGDERHLFTAMLTALRTLVGQCGSSMDDPAASQRLLEAAEPNFPAAMQSMKAKVAEAFGARRERCNPPDPHNPFPSLGVSHYSNPCGPS